MDFPAVEVDVVFAVVFVSADVEADVDGLAYCELVKEGAFVFYDLEFDVLWPLGVASGDDKFTFRESRAKCLDVIDDFNGALCFVHDAGSVSFLYALSTV